MSARMGICSECEEKKRLTPNGLVYLHKAMFQTAYCEGSRKPVKYVPSAEEILVAAGYSPEEVAPWTAAPEKRRSEKRRSKFREKLSGFFHKLKGCCSDFGWDFDDKFDR